MSELHLQPIEIEIKPYTPSEIAALYGVSWRVMNGWLKYHKDAIGDRIGLYYNVNQVKIILEKLGFPSRAKEAA
jgi:hypothetical protein